MKRQDFRAVQNEVAIHIGKEECERLLRSKGSAEAAKSILQAGLSSGLVIE